MVEVEGKNHLRVSDKKFLSPEIGEYGSIAWTIAIDISKREHAYDVMSLDIRLSDCSEHINLSFGCNDQAQYERRMAKLDTLIEELQTIRAKIQEHAPLIQHNIERCAKRKKRDYEDDD